VGHPGARISQALPALRESRLEEISGGVELHTAIPKAVQSQTHQAQELQSQLQLKGVWKQRMSTNEKECKLEWRAESLPNPSSAGSGTDYCFQTPEERRAEQGGGWRVERDASVIQYTERSRRHVNVHLYARMLIYLQ
ncbi:hypothetical protein FQN60_010933, partial [Etheostoma spectabile]